MAATNHVHIYSADDITITHWHQHHQSHESHAASNDYRHDDEDDGQHDECTEARNSDPI